MLPPTSATADSFKQAGLPSERRDNERSLLAARIEILEQSTNTAITGRLSDLSLGGCYADTLNTLAEGTPVVVRITHAQKTVELDGDVRFTQPSLGMGIGFHAVTPRQLGVLQSWIAPQQPKAAGTGFGGPSEDAQRNHASLLENSLGALVEILARKGVLSEEERRELLRDL
jgi:hypothetical protein